MNVNFLNFSTYKKSSSIFVSTVYGCIGVNWVNKSLNCIQSKIRSSVTLDLVYHIPKYQTETCIVFNLVNKLMTGGQGIPLAYRESNHLCVSGPSKVYVDF